MKSPSRLFLWVLVGTALFLLGLGLWASFHEERSVVIPPRLVWSPDSLPEGSASLHPLTDGSDDELPARIGGVASPARFGGLRHQWPGFHAAATFAGPGVNLRLDDPAGRYRVRIDETEMILTRPGEAELRVEGLSDGSHRISLEKLSEAAEPAWFGGFFLPPGSEALQPPRSDRVIEFLGDSDSLGYGITAKSRDCSVDAQFLATDSSLAFPAIVARDLGADYRLIARSGITLMRSAGNMLALRDAALPSDPGAPLAPEPAADVVVIGLGSNDLVEPLSEWPGGEARIRTDLERGIVELARGRLARSPGARLVLVAFGEYGPDLTEPYRHAQASLPGAQLVILPKLERTACDWHPSIADHALIAERLRPLLAAK